MTKAKIKRLLSILTLIVVLIIGAFESSELRQNTNDDSTINLPHVLGSQAGDVLSKLKIKGRAPKTGYDRSLFSTAWAEIDGCDMRNYILQRDLLSPYIDNNGCTVLSGTLRDPYTGKNINFIRGETTSAEVQIDHVVAVSDAWQKGAQEFDELSRYEFYNDPLNLLASSGASNQQKGNSDAASWLPNNKAFRCDYVARQIAVKDKYKLWVTRSEYEAMAEVLKICPLQELPLSD